MQEQLVDISLVIQKKSKGYMFYRPNHSMRIVKTGNARFIENGEISGSTVPREVEIKEVRVQVLLVWASSNKVIALFSCCY